MKIDGEFVEKGAQDPCDQTKLPMGRSQSERQSLEMEHFDPYHLLRFSMDPPNC